MMDLLFQEQCMQMFGRIITNEGIIMKALACGVNTKEAGEKLFEYAEHEINSGLRIIKNFGGE